MLRPFGPENATEILQLLEEGFPERGRAFWEKAIARLFAWPGNRELDYPPGFFWIDKNEPVGIILTPASPRMNGGETLRPIVNVSSWYVRETHRWKAPLMLRALFRDERVIFTDLTPTPDVQKMLPSFGFVPASGGIEWIGTPFMAFRASAARLRRWNPGEALAAGAPPDALIAEHVAWGCMALVLEQGSARHLLVLKPIRMRGLPGARILFAGSRAALEAGLPALARFMLARGTLLLRIDARPEGRRGQGYRPHGIWFARGDSFPDRTDHFGSELALFDF
ncbi:MAG: hypothetical protein MUF11_01520 [Beijerinckiaceae bacterium]|jgi:hypothetical protein|nr:hypothetical protein [Beijerinckiaceae bacterium]